MSLSNNFISSIFNKIDLVINQFVQITYTRIVVDNSLAITGLMTLYLIFLGYSFYYDAKKLDYYFKKIILLLLIWFMLLHWNWYNTIFYNIFTNEPARLSSTMVANTSSQHSSATILNTLDNIWRSGMSNVSHLYQKTNITQLQFLIYAISAFLATLLICGVATALFIFAKVGIAIILAIAPLFMIAYLFDTFKKYMDNWLSLCIYFALIPIVTTAIIALCFTLINTTIANINPINAQQAFSSLCAYCTIGLIITYLLLKVQTICTSLSGGVSLSGITDVLHSATTILSQQNLINKDR